MSHITHPTIPESPVSCPTYPLNVAIPISSWKPLKIIQNLSPCYDWIQCNPSSRSKFSRFFDEYIYLSKIIKNEKDENDKGSFRLKNKKAKRPLVWPGF